MFCRLGKTCNHVAALLFKLDHTWQTGLTNKTCTSKEVEWTKPSMNSICAPKEIRNINWSNHRYKVARKPQRNVFKGSTGTDSSLSELMDALYIDSSTACVWHYCLPEITNQILPEDNLKFDHTEKCTTTETLPQCIPDLVKEYGPALPSFTAQQVAMIASATIEQADCPLWHQQRTGRITGSTVHAVNVAAKNLRINNPVAKSTLDNVLGLHVA